MRCLLLLSTLTFAAFAAGNPVVEDRLLRMGRTFPDGGCAVVMAGGESYLFGGEAPTGLTNFTERIDAGGSAAQLAPMRAPLKGHACAALPNGRILVAGGAAFGVISAAIEIYDPASDKWSTGGTMTVARTRHAATALPSGSVVLTGGETPAGPTASIEILDAETGVSNPVDARLHADRYGHRGELQADGTILLQDGIPSDPEVFDPASNRVSLGSSTPAVRTIRFSGLDWTVKSSASSKVGPGPNVFSDSTNNVWVDSTGRLHLRLTVSGNTWQCAEVISKATFGYGTYRFYLDTPVDNFDPNVVAGFFTWKTGDPAYYYREIDIEFSKWGNARSPYNADYAVQPYTTPGHTLDFLIPAGLTKTTHSFLWTATSVTARSVAGASATPSNPSQIIREYTFRDGIPPTGGENVRMNLWLFLGNAPKSRTPVELIVNRFEFVPAPK